MSSARNESMQKGQTAHGRPVVFAAASLGIVFCAAVSAAEPAVTVGYQSSFADYRRFDAQAPTVPWRQANDALGIGSESAPHEMHDMHDMHDPTETAPEDATEPKPTASGEHREHRQ